MNLLRKLLAATVAASALAVPAVARVEAGTPSLIRTAEKLDVPGQLPCAIN